jgi:hypothetical protein
VPFDTALAPLRCSQGGLGEAIRTSENWYDTTFTVEVHPLEWGRQTRVLEVGTMAKGISGVIVPRKATDKYSTVTPPLNTVAPVMTP